LAHIGPRTRYHLLVFGAFPFGAAVFCWLASTVSERFLQGVVVWSAVVSVSSWFVRCPTCKRRTERSKAQEIYIGPVGARSGCRPRALIQVRTLRTGCRRAAQLARVVPTFSFLHRAGSCWNPRGGPCPAAGSPSTSTRPWPGPSSMSTPPPAIASRGPRGRAGPDGPGGDVGSSTSPGTALPCASGRPRAPAPSRGAR